MHEKRRRAWEKALCIDQAELVRLTRERMAQVDAALAHGPADDFAPGLLVQAKARPGAPAETALYVLACGPFNEAADKSRFMRAIGRQVYAGRRVPTAAVLAAEAWRAEGPEGRPRDDPVRQEVIVVAGCSLDHKYRTFATLPLGRNRVDNTIVPGAWSPVQTEGVGGALLDEFFRGFLEAAR